jgi:urease accessory protein
MAESLDLLHLLQLADSALPVGGMAHSFGLESLVELGAVQPESLECFLRDWLSETGLLEAVFCAQACMIPQEFAELNIRLSARKPARESREGSAAMGRRLIDLAARAFRIEPPPASPEIQYPCCFGYVAGQLGISPCVAVPAFLHQAVAALTSASLRLMPLGHSEGQAILFRIKPQIASVAAAAIAAKLDVPSFTPLLETASMSHQNLATRLFIS